ncbi:MAG: hypothetical protein K2W95_07310 [Candidatus Obscuribacterales bacterium]|nr:hypothetical protein [Candidatus Obscuribacterales bacterium]
MSEAITFSSLSDSGDLLQREKSAVSRFSTEFVHSFAYAGVQSPVNGVVQLADKAFGTDILPSVQLIDAPTQTSGGSIEWHGQVLGGAVGVAADFLLLRKTMRRPSVELPASVMVKRSALTGAVLNGVFRPTDPEQDFWTGRARAGVVGAVSFGSLSALQRPVDRLLQSVGIKSAFAAGVLSGVPVGVGESLLNNVTGGKHQDVIETAYASALTAGVLGKFHAFGQQARDAKLCRAIALENAALSAEAHATGSTTSIAVSENVPAPKIGQNGSVTIVRPYRLGDGTPIMAIAKHYSLPPRHNGEGTLVLEVNGKVRGYANLSDAHRSVGEVAVMPEYRAHSMPLLNAVKDHIASMGGVWHTMARASTSASLLELAARRGSIKIIEKSEPYRGPTEDMVDISFVVRAPSRALSGQPLRKFLGIDSTAPLTADRSTKALSESAHEQSNQWVSSQIITGKLARGVRVAPAFGEAIGTDGKQRGARYSLITVDESRDPTLRAIMKDAEARFSGLSGDKRLQAEELARYVRRICNPDNEGPSIERRGELALASKPGQAVPVGEFIRTNSALCVQSGLLYAKLANAHGIATTLRGAMTPSGMHAAPESLIGKEWLTFDSARAVYGAPSAPVGHRRRR